VLLDGSREQWLDSGREWSIEDEEGLPTVYPSLSCNSLLHVSRDTVLDMIGKPDRVVLDVRARGSRVRR